MGKKNYSKYQADVIGRYYDNLDNIMLQKLGELVTELYLAETAVKKEKLWQRAHKAMVKLNLKPALIDHIMKKRDAQVLAANLQDWLSNKK